MNLILFALGGLFAPIIAFSPLASHSHVLSSPSSPSRTFPERQRCPPLLFEYNDDNDSISTSLEDTSSYWNPSLRRVIGGMASLGMLETAYLTYSKITNGGDASALCGADGSCSSVLTGPYSVIPSTNIPLASLGLVAYTTVTFLALLPLLSSQDDDAQNRIWLTAGATAMGTFSVFLMSLLFGILHESCVFCVTSAALSIGMASLVWLGGAIPDENNDNKRQGVLTSAGTLITTVLAALVLFFTVEDTSGATQFAGTAAGSSDSRLLASSEGGYSPPPITTVSSERALALSSQLQALNARMYGAYWCSHCYDQKMAFGKEAFSRITYVECDKEGKNSERNLCKQRDVPGYPTWEINGKLYPGEQALEELQEIVEKAQDGSK